MSPCVVCLHIPCARITAHQDIAIVISQMRARSRNQVRFSLGLSGHVCCRTAKTGENSDKSDMLQPHLQEKSWTRRARKFFTASTKRRCLILCVCSEYQRQSTIVDHHIEIEEDVSAWPPGSAGRVLSL